MVLPMAAGTEFVCWVLLLLFLFIITSSATVTSIFYCHFCYYFIYSVLSNSEEVRQVMAH